jgi:hypothetical protein
MAIKAIDDQDTFDERVFLLRPGPRYGMIRSQHRQVMPAGAQFFADSLTNQFIPANVMGRVQVG